MTNQPISTAGRAGSAAWVS